MYGLTKRQEFDHYNSCFKKGKETMSYQQEIDNVSAWMKQYIKEAGAKTIVVGLSGGIDSSVIACLAVKAAGRDNVIGISMPCQSKEDMWTDANELANNLGIKFGTISLADSVDTTIDAIDALNFIDRPNQLGIANIKARQRMTTLYEIARQTGGIVAGTGNLSELMVGYFTKHGDGGVDIEPIGNYYKTEVYKMAELMPEIPEGSKTKAPSADLWDGQTDEEELGMTYAELDRILIACPPYYSWHKVYADQGMDEDKFNKVLSMIRRSDHKNNTPPRYDRKNKS